MDRNSKVVLTQELRTLSDDSGTWVSLDDLVVYEQLLSVQVGAPESMFQMRKVLRELHSDKGTKYVQDNVGTAKDG